MPPGVVEAGIDFLGVTWGRGQPRTAAAGHLEHGRPWRGSAMEGKNHSELSTLPRWPVEISFPDAAWSCGGRDRLPRCYLGPGSASYSNDRPLGARSAMERLGHGGEKSFGAFKSPTVVESGHGQPLRMVDVEPRAIGAPRGSQYLSTAEVITACSWNELVLSSDMPVLVEFWASWCGPCKMVGRLMDELAHEYSGKIQCFRIDADDYPRVAAMYGVERIPTILVFKHAEKLETIVGTLPKSVYVAAIQKLLSQ
ncbi:hypothetical protein KSP40_PGU013654 [Platanthera guangdongensis]|uniref:Thioredoxin domain-containing protein n=1 Tax=Platanthera guangdongensis TaxID=2320717 RepID=A0ABR2M3W1_9ASPA